jgi:hypothetical protein
MKTSDKPKTDNIGWIKALLFPKKSKPVAPAAEVTESDEPEALPRTPPAMPAEPPQPPKAPFDWSKFKPKFGSFKFAPAFWTITGTLSLIVNVILIVALIVLGSELFTLKRILGNELIGGLYANFIKMDEATIMADVPVNTSIHLLTDTVVVLTEQTTLNNARVTLNTGGLNITNAPATVVLQPGTELPVRLDLQVPININVAVNIPLKDTELHEPFVGLQDVIGPYYWMLQPQMNSWQDLPFCSGWVRDLCASYFK